MASDERPEIPFDAETTACVLDIKSLMQLPSHLQEEPAVAVRALLLPKTMMIRRGRRSRRQQRQKKQKDARSVSELRPNGSMSAEEQGREREVRRGTNPRVAKGGKTKARPRMCPSTQEQVSHTRGVHTTQKVAIRRLAQLVAAARKQQ